jgi:UDP-N-acetylglucosamine transferase subunit ALG13
MIVYTLGTIIFPFDRAINWLQILLEEEVIVEPVLLQHGSTSAAKLSHPLLTSVASLTNNEMYEAVKQASLVISHAGQGSTRMLAEMGACFVLLPRLKRYKEHVDDHQLLFARAVEKYGVHYCTELDQLLYYVKCRPYSFQGELFKAPLLAEHLIARYSLQLQQ